MSKSLKVVDIMTNNLIFHIIFLAVLLTGNNTFLLRCMTTNMEEGTKIELSYTVLKENKWIDIVDSTKVTNGEFVFQGDIEGVTAARLDFSNRFICIYILSQLKCNCVLTVTNLIDIVWRVQQLKGKMLNFENNCNLIWNFILSYWIV